MEKTQARVEDAQRDIDVLRMKRREAESNLESIIAAIQNTIVFVREQGASCRRRPVITFRSSDTVERRPS